MKSPAFIALDGLDGSGKETHTKLITEFLKENGYEYRYLSFPTYDKDYSRLVELYLSGRFGDDPEAVNPYAASSFFAADRYCSYMLDWRADYLSGKIIVSNRYTTGNAVHQLSKLPEAEWDSFLDWLMDYEFNKLGLPKPDLVLYLCLTPELALEQVNKRSRETGRDTDIHEKDATHLIKSYKAALYSAEKLGWKTVECFENNKIRSIRENHEIIMDHIKEFLK